jgi:serine/threonine protein kinase
MSPEQCNESGYNEKSDIWSLGIILYEMANLAPPFQANNHLSLALKIKEGVFRRIPEQYSEELMRVISWMLKPDPKQRPNVEDLLNLPNVSVRLRERALKRNLEHMGKKRIEIETKEQETLKEE